MRGANEVRANSVDQSIQRDATLIGEMLSRQTLGVLSGTVASSISRKFIVGTNSK
jgi:hypothetical protein